MSHAVYDTHVLFVCLSNICRSPTAEGVMRQRLAHANLAEDIRSRLAVE